MSQGRYPDDDEDRFQAADDDSYETYEEDEIVDSDAEDSFEDDETETEEDGEEAPVQASPLAKILPLVLGVALIGGIGFLAWDQFGPMLLGGDDGQVAQAPPPPDDPNAAPPPLSADPNAAPPPLAADAGQVPVATGQPAPGGSPFDPPAPGGTPKEIVASLPPLPTVPGDNSPASAPGLDGAPAPALAPATGGPGLGATGTASQDMAAMLGGTPPSNLGTTPVGSLASPSTMPTPAPISAEAQRRIDTLEQKQQQLADDLRRTTTQLSDIQSTLARLEGRIGQSETNRANAPAAASATPASTRPNAPPRPPRETNRPSSARSRNQSEDAARAPRAAARRQARGWALRGATPDGALLSGQGGSVIQVRVGETVPGLGRVTAIRESGDGWIVETTGGHVSGG